MPIRRWSFLGDSCCLRMACPSQIFGRFGAYEQVKVTVMAVLPLAYWVMKETWFPRYGYYKNTTGYDLPVLNSAVGLAGVTLWDRCPDV